MSKTLGERETVPAVTGTGEGAAGADVVHLPAARANAGSVWADDLTHAEEGQIIKSGVQVRSRPEDFIAAFAGRKILVLGDLILDHYVHGRAERLSPEAPVPVLRAATESWRPGGAANLAANIAALGGEATIIGLIGMDDDGERLSAALAALPGVRARLVATLMAPTIRKNRIMAGPQHIVRVDREEDGALTAEDAESLVDRFRRAAEECEIVVLSDYGKGVLSDSVLAAAIRIAQARGLRIVVDPKRTDFSAYAGADFLTPNRAELRAAMGLACDTDEHAEIAALKAQQMTGAAIVLTRSEQGMSLFVPGKAPVHACASAREVFDVAGAGDTAAACFALALASGAPPESAMVLANLAAGIVVEKSGVATCSAHELADMARSLSRSDAPHTRIHSLEQPLSWDEARTRCRAWRAEGLTIGFANGCFDLLHPGHISLLIEAANACDRLIVAINSDASVARLKGSSRPVQAEAARATVLAALGCVDGVIVFDEDTPLRAIEALEPDLLVKGADYREENVVGAAFVKARGGRVLLAALAAGHSSSALIARSQLKPVSGAE